MKKVTLLLMVSMLLVTFSSCSKLSESTYSLTNDTGLSGTVYINECSDSNETINIVSSYFYKGETQEYVADDAAVKVKLYIDELDRWVQQVYYLEKGGHVDIIINGNTIVGTQKP